MQYLVKPVRYRDPADRQQAYRGLWAQTRTRREIEQHDVDRVFALMRGGESRNILCPKGAPKQRWQVHGQWEPVSVSSPTMTCGSTRCSFGHADLAQPPRGLEVKGGQVVEHQREPVPAGRVRGPGDGAAVVAFDDPLPRCRS